MKYYLIAGEASGDMHAANLIIELGKLDTQAEFRCFGGDNMKEAGASLFIHYREMALMGFDVIKKYPVIRKNKLLCRADILNYKPDVLILVDYSGFNLPMARFAAENGIRVIYYISPKLWAWAKWRVKSVQKYVEKMFVLMPFEVDFYREHQVDAEYYGNPVLDSIENFRAGYDPSEDFRKKNDLPAKPIIALLAGSRKQEILHLLPEMLTAAESFPGYQFVIAGAPAIAPSYYENFTAGRDVRILYNQTYPLLMNSEAAVVTSGTATLETALLKVPEAVVYKTGAVTYFIGNFLVKIKFFSLVNLILDRLAVKELLQDNLSADIRSELELILNDTGYRTTMLSAFDELRRILGEPGVAARVAGRIHSILQPK
jgi:lipid-A-disaccharide synthase